MKANLASRLASTMAILTPSLFHLPPSQIPEAYLKWGFGVMMIVLGAKSIHASLPIKSAMAAAKKG